MKLHEMLSICIVAILPDCGKELQEINEQSLRLEFRAALKSGVSSRTPDSGGNGTDMIPLITGQPRGCQMKWALAIKQRALG